MSPVQAWTLKLVLPPGLSYENTEKGGLCCLQHTRWRKNLILLLIFELFEKNYSSRWWFLMSLVQVWTLKLVPPPGLSYVNTEKGVLCCSQHTLWRKLRRSENGLPSWQTDQLNAAGVLCSSRINTVCSISFYV